MTTDSFEYKITNDGNGRRRKTIDQKSRCNVRVLIPFFSFFLFVLSLKCVKVIEASTFFYKSTFERDKSLHTYILKK